MTLDRTPPDEARRILGIHYCVVCELDTMPCERDGRCFFCDHQVLRLCAYNPCRKLFWSNQPKRLYCSRGHRQMAWRQTDSGKEITNRLERVRRAKRRAKGLPV